MNEQDMRDRLDGRHYICQKITANNNELAAADRLIWEGYAATTTWKYSYTWKCHVRYLTKAGTQVRRA